MESNNMFKTDWLASNPVFYNEITGKISHNINEVIDFRNIEFHPEGLCNYLDYGYSVFEQTPLKNIKFLRHSSEVSFDNNKIKVNYFDDIAEKAIGKETHEDDVLNLLEKNVRKWESSVEGEIILPLSGGYDSRLLAYLIKDKKRIRAFTYGFSDNQEFSHEVVKAKKISEILQIDWEFIPLGFFHKFLDEWDNMFGISTHAHGMYHFEFYSALKSKISGGNPFLSGIIGDAWAGSLKYDDMNSYRNLISLAINGYMNADSSFCKLKSDNTILEKYYSENIKKIQDKRYQVIESMRLKIILLCYLFKVPTYFGFKPWSPFLDSEIALAMLNLPTERRKNRIWQSDFYKKVSLDVENQNLNFSLEYSLNYQAINNIRPKSLNTKLLKNLFEENYIDIINKTLAPKTKYQKSILTLLNIWGSRGILYRMGFRLNAYDKTTNEIFKAYFAYLTIKPIENILIKRDIIAKSKR